MRLTHLYHNLSSGHLHIVEHLISQRDLVGKQERIDALELLGATFVDKKRDMLGALKLGTVSPAEGECLTLHHVCHNSALRRRRRQLGLFVTWYEFPLFQ